MNCKAENRICFDVTLKGFDEINVLRHIRFSDSGVISELTKWVVAPNREALDRFIERTGLLPFLNATGPFAMSQRASGYGVEDGVDVILDSDGNVIEKSDGFNIQHWFALVEKALSVVENNK